MKKIAFATCVQLGLSCIQEIYKIGGKLDLLITLKDEKSKTKSGRIYLDKVAKEQQAPLLKINNINDVEVLKALQKYNIDWLFIIGWSQIAKKEVLMAPNNGCIGMHPTLLPVGRGRAAIPWAILKGLDKTGVTMFKLDEGVDTGPIIAQTEISLNNKMTATELYDCVNRAHVELISEYWYKIINDQVVMLVQDETKATTWPGRKPKDGEIVPEMTMSQAETLVRAVTKPYPGAFFYKDNKKITIWSAEISSEKGDIKLKDGYLIPLNYEIEE